jgi:hypothetical protein
MFKLLLMEPLASSEAARGQWPFRLVRTPGARSGQAMSLRGRLIARPKRRAMTQRLTGLTPLAASAQWDAEPEVGSLRPLSRRRLMAG